MRKWWNNLRRYLSGRIKESEEQALPISLKKVTPPRAQPELEPTLHQAIRWYGRRKVRQEIQTIHRRLISDKPDGPLARQIRRLFPGRNPR